MLDRQAVLLSLIAWHIIRVVAIDAAILFNELEIVGFEGPRGMAVAHFCQWSAKISEVGHGLWYCFWHAGTWHMAHGRLYVVRMKGNDELEMAETREHVRKKKEEALTTTLRMSSSPNRFLHVCVVRLCDVLPDRRVVAAPPPWCWAADRGAKRIGNPQSQALVRRRGGPKIFRIPRAK